MGIMMDRKVEFSTLVRAQPDRVYDAIATVEIDFAPVNHGTAVHLVEYGYEDSPAGTQDFLNRVSGWAQVLTLMKFYVEHGVTY